MDDRQQEQAAPDRTVAGEHSEDLQRRLDEQQRRADDDARRHDRRVRDWVDALDGSDVVAWVGPVVPGDVVVLRAELDDLAGQEAEEMTQALQQVFGGCTVLVLDAQTSLDGVYRGGIVRPSAYRGPDAQRTHAARQTAPGLTDGWQCARCGAPRASSEVADCPECGARVGGAGSAAAGGE